MIKLPEEHALRRELNDEAHARPPEALVAPARISFVALFDTESDRARHIEPVRRLCAMFDAPLPSERTNHLSIDLGLFKLKWERHTEFTRYKFTQFGKGGEPFSRFAIDAVPADWLATLPGKPFLATHVELVGSDLPRPDIETLSSRWFGGNPMVGAIIADGAGSAFTDFRIHNDGFSRVLMWSERMAPRQLGRAVQRVLEIDAYRILALMALPEARALGPFLAASEAELVSITNTLASQEAIDEPRLLDQLTRLEAVVQKRHFETAGRFSAAEAYYRLIQRRTEELRERRLDGVQTFRDFVERRLDPAMNTCMAISARQEKLSHRVAQTTQLLSTRVDVSRQQQNQGVLQSMNRRALLQLRMQETVEGISVVAISYYLTGLLSYLVKGLAAAGLAARHDLIVAVSIPIVVLLVALGVRRIRKKVLPERIAGQIRSSVKD